MAARRARARVDGTVQGVGFRPYVYAICADLGLSGFVRNDERGVVVEVEGAPDAVEGFLRRLPAEAPPLAAVEAVRVEELAPTGLRGFAIAPSAGGGRPTRPCRPTRRRATTACASSSTRPTGATATRS